MTRSPLQTVAFTALLSACGSDVCVAPPCIESIAVNVNVTGAAGVPLSGVFVMVTAPNERSGSCQQGASLTNCFVPGGGGHYELQIGATGFQTVTRAVDVSENAGPRCGCGTVQTVTLGVQLSPQTG
jgi:hypothetical protein